jgi:hypothetical protein
MGRISSKLSYANVVATLALFVALGGGAYAASTFVHATGVVDLCVSHSGAVNVLAAKKSRCGKGTSLVPVNQRGAAGAPGPTGAPGAAGTPAPADIAGSGLTLSGTSLSANLAQVQARITGSGCASGQALQSVAQNGTPTCASLHVYQTPVVPSSQYSQNASVAIPAGTWLLLGQAEAANETPSSSDTVTCKLEVQSQAVDTVTQSLPPSDNYTISPFATTTTTVPSTVVQITCQAGLPSTDIGGNLTLVALPLDALN